jgi:hypothetical protein
MAVIFLVLSFVSCGTRMTTAVTKQHEQTTVENRMSLTGGDYLHELTEQTLLRLVNSRHNVSIGQIKYDTDRPVDTLTGRPPIAEEISITINTDTEIIERDNIASESRSGTFIGLDDISAAGSDVQAETTESKQTGMNAFRTTLMYAGGLLIIAVIAIIALKAKGWI